MIPRVSLPNGTSVPALGQGTWHMGEQRGNAAAEIAALQLGIELGMSLIDTAEMYADGGAERIVGQAIAGRRDQVFLVSKVYPHNATVQGMKAACERSLKRLGTETIDLYLLHWRGSVPLAETLAGFATLQKAGKIRFWGVSNFDADDMAELTTLAGGAQCAANQVLYHLDQRGIEFDLLPYCQQAGIAIMAYSPLGQAGQLLHSRALAKVAQRHGMTPAQIALAWCLRQPGVIAIPKASQLAHVCENAKAASLRLDAEDLAELDAHHPPPGRKRPLAIL
jgi:diketogulonate reductase-like aldo/keto reductase